MFTFTHAGKLGDILYSLYYCLEVSRSFHFDKFNYDIQVNKKISDFDEKCDSEEILLTRKDAEFIRPLLKSLPYVNDVTVGGIPGSETIDLNSFRRRDISPYGCEIRDWYYMSSPRTFPREFWKRLIQVEPNPKYRDRILFTLTERYVNIAIDYKQLEQFREHLVFIGTDREYHTFQEQYFELERAELTEKDDLLTVAQYLGGAKGYMANQSCFFSLAELMKINRILLSPDWVRNEDGEVKIGPKNNLPLGGWCSSVSMTWKMVSAVRELLKME